MCAGAFSVAAVDRTNGKVLWFIKDGDDSRLVPDVTAVWHGRVYGSVRSGPVALDARTGKDMPTKPEVAPILVNEYVGLTLTDGVLSSLPAGG